MEPRTAPFEGGEGMSSCQACAHAVRCAAQVLFRLHSAERVSQLYASLLRAFCGDKGHGCRIGTRAQETALTWHARV